MKNSNSYVFSQIFFPIFVIIEYLQSDGNDV